MGVSLVPGSSLWVWWIHCGNRGPDPPRVQTETESTCCVLTVGTESPLSPEAPALPGTHFTGQKTEPLVAELVPGHAAQAARAPGAGRSPWGTVVSMETTGTPRQSCWGVSTEARGPQGAAFPVTPSSARSAGGSGDSQPPRAPRSAVAESGGGFLINRLAGHLPTLEARIIAIFNGVDLAATIL